ncbi:MAG TPA: hypothetical protein VK116_18570, partial [Planctomycetota bacterium]|nr:hypothetical protein [Planctomycetota bacterium]
AFASASARLVRVRLWESPELFAECYVDDDDDDPLLHGDASAVADRKRADERSQPYERDRGGRSS